MYLEYLDKIGQHFFGVPPPQRAQPGGMFSGIFDSLLSAFNDDDDEDGDESPAAAAAASSSKQSTSKAKMATEDLD